MKSCLQIGRGSETTLKDKYICLITTFVIRNLKKFAEKCNGGYNGVNKNQRKGLIKMTDAVTYTKVGDYKMPNLTVPTKEYKIGKYGMMRRTYLKQHRPSLYSILLMKGELLRHLDEIDKSATEQVQAIVSQMASVENVNEELKAESPLKWTGLMNNFLHSAEETVLPELICG